MKKFNLLLVFLFLAACGNQAPETTARSGGEPPPPNQKASPNCENLIVPKGKIVTLADVLNGANETYILQSQIGFLEDTMTDKKVVSFTQQFVMRPKWEDMETPLADKKFACVNMDQIKSGYVQSPFVFPGKFNRVNGVIDGDLQFFAKAAKCSGSKCESSQLMVEKKLALYTDLSTFSADKPADHVRRVFFLMNADGGVLQILITDTFTIQSGGIFRTIALATYRKVVQ